MITLTLTVAFNSETDAHNAAAMLENRVIAGRVTSHVTIARVLTDRDTAL